MAAASSSSRQDGGQRKSKKHKYPTTPLDDEAEECKCSDGKYYCPYQTNPKNPKKGKDSKPCGMSFTLPSDWRKHIKTHKPTHHCPADGCNYSTAEEREMDNHYRSQHGPKEDKRWFQCPYCDQVIAYKKSNVDRHIDKMHRGKPKLKKYETAPAPRTDRS